MWGRRWNHYLHNRRASTHAHVRSQKWYPEAHICLLARVRRERVWPQVGSIRISTCPHPDPPTTARCCVASFGVTPTSALLLSPVAGRR